MGTIYYLLIVTISFIYSLDAMAFFDEKAICGPEDNRVEGTDPTIGRMHDGLLGRNGCTATLISRRCVVTAGHCKKYYKTVEFKIPLSNFDGSINHSDPKDIYDVKEDSFEYSRGVGSDWAVMLLEKNAITKEYPGDVYGFHKVAYKVEVGDYVTISGYGTSKNSPLHGALKYESGFIARINNRTLSYQIDTTGGDSGSAVINGKGEIIGIHSHGGCYRSTMYTNKGTNIADNPRFIKAIKACLKADAASN